MGNTLREYVMNRYHGFIRNELPELVVREIYRFRVFKEADLQCVVYRLIMRWMDRNYPPDTVKPRFLLNQPRLKEPGGKTVMPDLIMYHGNSPIVAIELKLEIRAMKPDSEISKDVQKLEQLRKKYRSLKSAYLISFYDGKSTLEYSRNQAWMKRFFFPIAINVRTMPRTGRTRRRYAAWRRTWLRLYGKLYN